MDFILLIFLCWQIGKKAEQKGLRSGPWRLRLVLTWLGFEFAGMLLGILLFGFNKNDMVGLAAFALACAFGGYLYVKAALDKKIDQSDQEKIDNIGRRD